MDDAEKRRRTKALGYLRDGRVAVMALFAARAGTVAEVIVRGHYQDHLLEADGTAWTCTCPPHEQVDGPLPCSHALAADLVCHVVVPISDKR
jgi:hypothetical protein